MATVYPWVSEVAPGWLNVSQRPLMHSGSCSQFVDHQHMTNPIAMFVTGSGMIYVGSLLKYCSYFLQVSYCSDLHVGIAGDFTRDPSARMKWTALGFCRDVSKKYEVRLA